MFACACFYGIRAMQTCLWRLAREAPNEAVPAFVLQSITGLSPIASIPPTSAGACWAQIESHFEGADESCEKHGQGQEGDQVEYALHRITVLSKYQRARIGENKLLQSPKRGAIPNHVHSARSTSITERSSINDVSGRCSMSRCSCRSDSPC